MITLSYERCCVLLERWNETVELAVREGDHCVALCERELGAGVLQ